MADRKIKPFPKRKLYTYEKSCYSRWYRSLIWSIKPNLNNLEMVELEKIHGWIYDLKEGIRRKIIVYNPDMERQFPNLSSGHETLRKLENYIEKKNQEHKLPPEWINYFRILGYKI